MKWLHREILNSRTYQLSWIPNSTNRLDERNFSRAVPRRLPAEVAYDIMVQATLNTSKNAEFVTSLEKRALSIPGSGLRQRGRNPADYALTVFGRSVRESNCDCDRTEEPSLLQTIFVRNDAQVLSLLDAGDGWLREVAEQNQLNFQPRSVPDGGNAQQKAQAKARFEAQIQRIRERLAEAQQNGADRQIAILKAQLRRLREQARTLGVETPDEPEGEVEAVAETPPAKVNLKTEEIITDAYLRSLSRLPTADELQTAGTFMTESGDPVEGIRAVLWALMNTREFMVNH